MSKHPSAPPSKAPHGADAGQVEASHHGDEEVLHVPRGQKRAQFLILLVLSILTLVIFTVGDVLSMMGNRGPSRADTFLSWVHPTRGEQRVSFAEFIEEKRALENFYRITQQGNPRAWRDQVTDPNVAYLLITEQLALDAGIDVSDPELARTLLQGSPNGRVPPFGTRQTYEQFLQFTGVEPRAFERMVKRILRVDRYEAFIAAAFTSANPRALEQAWKNAHGELKFEALKLSHADFAEQAAAALPDQAGLKAWYEGQKEPKLREWFGAEWRPLRLRAELAWLDLSAGDPLATAAKLLEKYPRPAGADLDLLAKSFFDTQIHVRFKREVPLTEGPDERSKIYHAFEEVKDRARNEAQIHAALRDWLAALDTRAKAGETVDLETEAKELGLAFERSEKALTAEEWRATAPDAEGQQAAGLRGPFLSSALIQAGPSGWPVAPVVEAKAMAIAKVLERQAEGPPEFESVAQKAAETWKTEQQVELAMAKLKAAHDSLPPVEGAQTGTKQATGEVFAAKAAEIGTSVLLRDWFDGADELTKDPTEGDDLARFLRQQLQVGTTLAEGVDQVSPPIRGKDANWLVRTAGKRAPESLRMKPAELDFLRFQASQLGEQEAREKLLSPKVYAQKYKMTFPNAKQGEGDAQKKSG